MTPWLMGCGPMGVRGGMAYDSLCVCRVNPALFIFVGALLGRKRLPWLDIPYGGMV